MLEQDNSAPAQTGAEPQTTEPAKSGEKSPGASRKLSQPRQACLQTTRRWRITHILEISRLDE